MRTSAGPIGPILDRLRTVLEPWLGRAQFDQSPVVPKFRFRVAAGDGSGVPIRLKVEVNTREIEAYDPPHAMPLRVENPGFTGEAAIPTFSREEMLATKLQALLQRDKGRDLYDLSDALETFHDLDTVRIAGFAPIKLGGLSEGGLLVQARGNGWGQLIFKDLVKFDG